MRLVLIGLVIALAAAIVFAEEEGKISSGYSIQAPASSFDPPYGAHDNYFKLSDVREFNLVNPIKEFDALNPGKFTDVNKNQFLNQGNHISAAAPAHAAGVLLVLVIGLATTLAL